MANSKSNDFYHNVHEVVAEIPKGRVTTYGLIAKLLGAPQSSRMVGYALNVVPEGMDIPAHRVVNRNGLLTGKKAFGKPDRMQKLLEQEGIEIKNDQVQDFENVLWNPFKEL